MKKALPPFVQPDSEILILGTMPGDKSIALQQYYGNRGNHFWKILFQVFDEPFSTDFEKRLALLRTRHIALWNVLAQCEREGSSDNSIKNAIANDIEGFLRQHPSIKKLYFESKSAAAFYQKMAGRMPGIDYAVLPSTSGLNAGLSFAEKLAAWEQIRTR